MRVGTVLAGLLALVMCLMVLSWVAGMNRKPKEDPPAGTVKPLSESSVHDNNPFEGEHPSPPPKLEIEETSFNFGVMELGGEMTHAFVVRNSGEGALKLAVGRSTCKCTVGKLDEDSVPPDGDVEVKLTWRPHNADPAFTQQATIFSNDPEHAEFQLEVGGIVARRLEVLPGDTWTLTSVSETQETPFEFVIFSQLLDGFEITSVEPSNDLIHVDVVPLSQEELSQLPEFGPARSGYRLHGRLGLGFPVGEIHEYLTVSTDVKDYEKLPLSIMTSRIGPFSVIGPGWLAASKMLDLGRFESRDGKTVKLGMFVEEESGGFQFTDVHVEPPVLDVSWERDSEFESPTRHRIWIQVVAPAGMTPVRRDSADPIKVVMSTNDPNVPEWTFFVALQAN